MTLIQGQIEGNKSVQLMQKQDRELQKEEEMERDTK